MTGRYLSFGDWRGFKECSRPSPTQRLGCLSVVGFWPESRANAETAAWDGWVAFTISTDYILCLYIYTPIYMIYEYIYINKYIYICICDLYVSDYTNWLQRKLQGKPYCIGSQSTSHGYHPTLAVQRALGDVVVSVGTMAVRRWKFRMELLFLQNACDALGCHTKCSQCGSSWLSSQCSSGNGLKGIGTEKIWSLVHVWSIPWIAWEQTGFYAKTSWNANG